MQLTSPTATKAVLRGLLWAVPLVAAAYAVLFGMVVPPKREQARLACCQQNLRHLQNAAASYAMDWDGRLPPRPAPGGDFVAFHWSAVPMEVGSSHGYHIAAPEGGPLWEYAKNACINRCPSDPDNDINTYAAGAHSSYVWNTDLSGKLLKDVPGQPLAWERAPFHRGGRNLVWTDQDEAHPKWLPELDFQALELIQR